MGNHVSCMRFGMGRGVDGKGRTAWHALEIVERRIIEKENVVDWG